MAAILERRIWLRISTIVYGGDFIYPTQVVRSAKESVEEFHKASHNPRNNKKKNQATVRLRYWKEPLVGGDKGKLRTACWGDKGKLGCCNRKNKKYGCKYNCERPRGKSIGINVFHKTVYISDLTIAKSFAARKVVKFNINWDFNMLQSKMHYK